MIKKLDVVAVFQEGLDHLPAVEVDVFDLGIFLENPKAAFLSSDFENKGDEGNHGSLNDPVAFLGSADRESRTTKLSQIPGFLGRALRAPNHDEAAADAVDLRRGKDRFSKDENGQGGSPENNCKDNQVKDQVAFRRESEDELEPFLPVLELNVRGNSRYF